jgi:hypothetical protein
MMRGNGVTLQQLEAGESVNLLGEISNQIGFYIGVNDQELRPTTERIEQSYLRGLSFRRKFSRRRA